LGVEHLVVGCVAADVGRVGGGIPLTQPVPDLLEHPVTDDLLLFGVVAVDTARAVNGPGALDL